MSSTPTLNRRTKSRSSLSVVPTSSRSRIGGLLKKASSEFNLFCLRIKSLGEEVFSENQVISEFFDDIGSESDSLLDRLERSSKGYSITEERFLSSYKKFKSLDKMHLNYKETVQNEDIKSSSTVCSDSQVTRFNLKDVIQESYSGHVDFRDIEGETEDEDEDEDTLGTQSSNSDKVNFHELDIVKVRQELESDASIGDANVGEVLWEYRRSRWLKNTKRNVKTQVNNSRLLFDQIPRDSYVKVYTTLVDKGRPLKSDRRINLHDLMKLINAGWAAEDKWDRAAKGLP